jgi:hypothetical protein
VDYTNLIAFILPELSKLAVISDEDIAPEESPLRFWIFFSLAIILVLILGFIAYIAMQQWYKNKYESHLFKNKNSLYNLLNYVQNQKKQGVEAKEMRSRLRKAGWTGEQINYVIKKNYGKKTGLFFEIPVEKLLGSLNKDVTNINNPVNKTTRKQSFE